MANSLTAPTAADKHQTGRIVGRRESRSFRITRGTKQGDPISPQLFNAVLQEAVETLRKQWIARGWGIRIGPFNEDSLLNLRFADDLLLFAKSLKVLKKMMTELQTAVGKVGLHLHMGKTKILTNCKDKRLSEITCRGQAVKILAASNAEKYLGRKLSTQDYHHVELENRLASAWRG